MADLRASSPTAWRTVDIVVAAVIAVAFGVVFWAWNALWAATSPASTRRSSRLTAHAARPGWRQPQPRSPMASAISERPAQIRLCVRPDGNDARTPVCASDRTR